MGKLLTARRVSPLVHTCTHAAILDCNVLLVELLERSGAQDRRNSLFVVVLSLVVCGNAIDADIAGL